MPGIASHMVVAKLVGEKLKLNSDDFIQGNIMPDILLENLNYLSNILYRELNITSL